MPFTRPSCTKGTFLTYNELFHYLPEDDIWNSSSPLQTTPTLTQFLHLCANFMPLTNTLLMSRLHLHQWQILYVMPHWGVSGCFIIEIRRLAISSSRLAIAWSIMDVMRSLM